MDEQNNINEPVADPAEAPREAPRDEAGQMLKEAYAEAGLLFRQFSTRRARLFAGYLLTVAGVALAFGWFGGRSEGRPAAWITLAAGCVLTLVFWALERRSRQIIFACIGAASDLERELGIHPEHGVYTKLRKLPEGEPAPGRTFDWMYFLATLGFLVGTVYLLAETI